MTAVTTLRIDHLEARYHDVTVDGVALLDRALAGVVADGLDRAVTDAELGGGLLDDPLDAAWAVCLQELSVDVELDPASPAEAASLWSRAIVGALHEATHEQGSGGGGDAGWGTVVYRSEVDALIALVRGHADGELRHAWAWRQVGLLPVSREALTHADVVDALLARPRLAPAVVAAVGARRLARLADSDLLRLARAVLVEVGGPVADLVLELRAGGAPPPPLPMPLPRGVGVGGTDRRDRSVGQVEAAAGAALAALPRAVWSAVADPADRVALALLATAATTPALSRDVSHVVLVSGLFASDTTTSGRESRQLSAAGHVADRSVAFGTDERDDTGPPADDDGPEPVDHQDEESQPDDSAEDAGAEAPEAPAELRSAWGGVWFLTHAVAALDLVDDLVTRGVDVQSGLRVVLAEVTGAPPDDPCVAWLSGAGDPDDASAPAPAATVLDLAAAVSDWLTRRAELRSPDLDPPSLWRRPVVLRRSPGLVEVGLSLDDVDLNVRRAGLDLDPGWVWWLGATVRFRYA